MIAVFVSPTFAAGALITLVLAVLGAAIAHSISRKGEGR